MAMKATKFSTIIKALAGLDTEAVIDKIDTEAAKTQNALADFPQALGNVACVMARVTEHQATTMRLLSEGLLDMSTGLREPVPAEGTDLTDQSGPDLDEPLSRDERRAASKDKGGHGIIFADGDERVFYGPGSHELVLAILHSGMEGQHYDLVGPSTIKQARQDGKLQPLHQLPGLTDAALLRRAAALDPEFTK